MRYTEFNWGQKIWTVWHKSDIETHPVPVLKQILAERHLVGTKVELY